MENPAHVHYLFYRQFCKMLFIRVISCQLSHKNTKITLILYTYYSYVWTYYWFKECSLYTYYVWTYYLFRECSLYTYYAWTYYWFRECSLYTYYVWTYYWFRECSLYTYYVHIIGSGSVLLLHLLLWTCRLREKLYISQGTKKIKNEVNLC